MLLHGRMYITDTFIGFYTNLFGIEKKIQIGLKAITSVKPLTTIMFIPNAITIETGGSFSVARFALLPSLS